MDDRSTPGSPIAARILAAAGWVLLGMLILGLASTLPGIKGWLARMDRDPLFAARHDLGTRIVGIAGVAAWAAAVWYAIRDPERHLLPKPLIVFLLLFSNFVGAFIYYFLFVFWRHRGGHRRPLPSPGRDDFQDAL
jgi:hypothetical protein